MKKHYALITGLFLLTLILPAAAAPLLNCDFTVAAKACVNQQVTVTYTGGAGANATYTWNFDGAIVVSGTGAGPYVIRWETAGEKHLSLSIQLELQTCSVNRTTTVVELPAVFHMTGGGVYVPGTAGVNVGLGGSEAGVIYKLRLGAQYTGVAVTGTGQAISFGPQTVPGSYNAVAKVDGADCLREMEGTAVVTSGEPPAMPYICMVTFDTLTSHNKVVWNKPANLHLSHFNIYRETYQNNVFTKIGEVPYTSVSTFIDPTADPIVRSDKYRISSSDSAGHESEKSPFHKTVHLNINPGIYGFNLIWNHYEGFEFLTYRIHRKHLGGAWETIDSVASNVNSYTDGYTASGITTYYIEVVRPEPCHPTLKSGEYEGVISNTAAAAPLGVSEGSMPGLKLWPNPARDLLNLSLPETEHYRVEATDATGRTVFSREFTGNAVTFQVSGLAPGLYLLKVTGDRTVTLRKFMKD